MIAGTLEIQMLANLARLSDDMSKAKGLVSGAMNDITGAVGKAKTALAALGIGIGLNELKNYVTGVISAAAALDDMAERTGASVEKLSELTLVAKIGGINIETLETGLTKLARSIAVVGQQTDAASGALKAIGLTKGQLQGLDTADAFKLVAQRLNEYADGLNKTAVLQALFGKGGAALAPIIKDLADQHEKLRLITAAEAAESERLEKQWRQLALKASELRRSFIIDMVGPLNELVGAIREAQRESGTLTAAWVALGGAAALILGNTESQKLKSRIDELQKQIELGKKQLETGSLNPPGAAKSFWSFLIPDVKLSEDAKSTIRAQIQQAQGELQDLLEKLKGPKAPEKSTIPELPDLALLKAAEDERQKFLDAQLKYELEALKDQAQHKQQLLDMSYANNMVSDEVYYRTRLEIAKDTAESEIAVLDFRMAREEQVLNEQTRQTKEYYEARARLDATVAQRNKIITEFGQLTEVTFAQAKKSAEQYQGSLEDVNAQILELTGNTADAARIRFQIQNRNLINQAISNNDPAALADIEKLQGLTEAQAKFNQKKTELSDLNALLQVQEERIQNSFRTGSITELESLQRTGEARKAALDSMQKTVDALKQIALASNNPALLVQAEQAAVALEKLRTETDLVAQKFETIFTESFSSAFSDFITGAKTAKQAFNDFANSVVKKLADMYAEAIAKNIWRAMGMGNVTSGGGGIFGAGGLLGLLGIGGSNNTPAPASVSNGGELFGQFATGTDYVPRTGPYLLHQGEKVVPAGENSGGVTIHMPIEINAPGADAGAVQRIEAGLVRLERSIVPRMTDALRRNAIPKQFR